MMTHALSIPTLPAEPAWLSDARQHAAAGFAVPTQKVEAWKYTGLNSLKNVDFSGGSETSITIDTNGDLPDGVKLLRFAEAVAEMPDVIEAHFAPTGVNVLPFPALNTAMTEDGYVLIVDDGVTVDGLIDITFLSNSISHPRNLILAGANSKATILQRHISNGAGAFTNALTKLTLGAGAEVGFYRLQNESADAHHISTVDVQLDKEAQFNNYTLTLGGKLSRNEIHVALTGSGGEAKVDGGYLLAEDQHGDTTTYIDHMAADTSSTQTYKGVLDDKAQGVFAGRIKIHPDAQRVEGRQLSRALLLSQDASVNTKPELEIHADDVKCSHGATAGELGEDSLFYLRSRGIPERRARHMLIEAFVAEGLAEIGSESVRDLLGAEVANWLEAHRQ